VFLSEIFVLVLAGEGAERSTRCRFVLVDHRGLEVETEMKTLRHWYWVFVAALILLPGALMAQTTATNAVELISDNVTNARDTMVPLAIAALVLFVGIAAAVKFWKRIFGR